MLYIDYKILICMSLRQKSLKSISKTLGQTFEMSIRIASKKCQGETREKSEQVDRLVTS